ncbi:MAG: hypothetical protein Q6365_013165 [Candidatus Sigynarchaeota archaeon]
MNQLITLPSIEPVKRGIYFLIQYVSSSFLILGAGITFFPFLAFMNPVFAINSLLFFSALLGLNLFIFFKKKGIISLELSITCIICIGLVFNAIIGQIFYSSKIAYYSEFAGITAGVLNLTITNLNQNDNSRIKITFQPSTKWLILIFFLFLIIRLSLMLDGNVWLDDENYLISTIKFIDNEQSLLPYNYYSEYYQMELGWAIPFGFPIILGMVLKGAGVIMISPRLYLLVFSITMNSVVIFPTYSLLERVTKNEKVRYMLLFIIILNQWNFIDAPSLLVDATYMLLFTISFYFFILALEHEGSFEENIIYSTIAGALGFFVRPNGIVQYTIQVLIFLILIVVLKDNTKKCNTGDEYVFRLPRWKTVRILIVQGVMVFLFAILYQIEYIIEFGMPSTNHFLHGVTYGYFGEGNLKQFTEVDNFTFSWLWERLAYNVPFYISNFSQLLGFIYIFSGDVVLKDITNTWVSITCVAILGMSLLYSWYKYWKRNTILSLYNILLFIGMFAPIILWGEVYFFSMYRWTYPILILFIPSLHDFGERVLYLLEKVFRREFNARRGLYMFLSPFLILTIYGAVGIIGALIPKFWLDVISAIKVFKNFIGWQFL